MQTNTITVRAGAATIILASVPGTWAPSADGRTFGAERNCVDHMEVFLRCVTAIASSNRVPPTQWNYVIAGQLMCKNDMRAVAVCRDGSGLTVGTCHGQYHFRYFDEFGTYHPQDIIASCVWLPTAYGCDVLEVRRDGIYCVFGTEVVTTSAEFQSATGGPLPARAEAFGTCH